MGFNQTTWLKDGWILAPTDEKLGCRVLVDKPLLIPDGRLERSIQGFEINSSGNNLARLPNLWYIGRRPS